MKFEVNARPTKLLWSGNGSFLYLVEEDSEKKKKWSIFTAEQLNEGQLHKFTGTVSESKDKKVKDSNGRDIWRATFSADKIEGVATNDDIGPEFSQSDDIPF